MEDMDLATKPAQIQLGHSFAAVSLATSNQDLTALTSMNVYPMEEEVHVHKYVQTPLDHSSAVVILDMLFLDMPVMTSMNAFPMEDWVRVHRYAPIPLDHSSAAVSLDTHHLDMPAMILMNVLRAPVAAHSCVITPLEVISVCAIQAIIRPLITLPV